MRCFTATAPASPSVTCLSALAISVSVHTRHSRWSRSGVWRKIFEALAQDADNAYVMIDATIVRAHQHSAGAKGKIQTSRLLDVAAAL